MSRRWFISKGLTNSHMADLIYNKQGKLTRKAKPREIVPAVERFFARVVEQPGALPMPCLLWKGARFIRVTERTVRRPWRFYYEIENGVLTPNGANWQWLCDNPNSCCEPSHLVLNGHYCKS